MKRVKYTRLVATYFSSFLKRKLKARRRKHIPERETQVYTLMSND